MFRLIDDANSGIPFCLISIYFTVSLIFCQVCYYIYSLANLIRTTDEPIPIPRRRGPFHYRSDESQVTSHFARTWSEPSQEFEDIEEFESFSIPTEVFDERILSSGEELSDFRTLNSRESQPVETDVYVVRMSSVRERPSQDLYEQIVPTGEHDRSPPRGRSYVRRVRPYRDSYGQTRRVPTEEFTDRTSSVRERSHFRRGSTYQDSHEQTFPSYPVSSEMYRERMVSAQRRLSASRGRAPHNSHEQTFQSPFRREEFAERTHSITRRSCGCWARSAQQSNRRTFSFPDQCEAFTGTSFSRRRSYVHRGRSPQGSREETLRSFQDQCNVFGERISSTTRRSSVSRDRSSKNPYVQAFQSLSVPHDKLTGGISSVRRRSPIRRVRLIQDSHEETLQSSPVPQDELTEGISLVRGRSSVRRVFLSQDSQEQNIQSHSFQHPEELRSISSSARQRLSLERGRSSRTLSQDYCFFPECSAPTSRTYRQTVQRQHYARPQQFVQRSRPSHDVSEMISKSSMENEQNSNRHRYPISERLEQWRPETFADLLREKRALLSERRALLRQRKVLYAEGETCFERFYFGGPL